MEPTKVIFRKFKDKEIIALFPEIEAGERGYNCLSYMTVGQHSPADPSIVHNTTLAIPEEYQELYTELEEMVGYKLQVVKKFTQKHYEIRKNQCK